MLQLRTLVVLSKWISLVMGLLVLLTMGDLGAPTTAWSQQGVTSVAAPNPVGSVFSYQGRLSTSSGLATGNYDFRFTLYDAESGGTAVGATVEKPTIPVAGGAFTVQLDFGAGAFTGAPRWLEIAVRQASSGNFETLAPRQPLTPVPYAIYADTTNLNTVQARVSGTCADGSSIRVIGGDGTVTCEPDDIGGNNHNHLGQTWTGQDNPLVLNGSFASAPLSIDNTGSGDTLAVNSASGNGIDVRSNGSGDAGDKYATIYAENNGSANTVYAQNRSNYTSIYANNTGTGYGFGTDVQAGYGVIAFSNGTNNATIRGSNLQDGAGGLFTSYNGTNILVAQEETTRGNYANRFRVALNGEVYATLRFNAGGADFAEMLPAAPGLEPGDVLVIGMQGILIRATTANSTNVAGVYSTKPGFMGGFSPDGNGTTSVDNRYETGENLRTSGAGGAQLADVLTNPNGTDMQIDTPVAPKAERVDPLTLAYTEQGKIPLAILGIVPVKVTAENGPIQPGDLLTTASTPGHAMKASPVNLSGIELYRPGTIIGKALEPWTDGAGVIQVLIALQ